MVYCNSTARNKAGGSRPLLQVCTKVDVFDSRHTSHFYINIFIKMTRNEKRQAFKLRDALSHLSAHGLENDRCYVLI